MGAVELKFSGTFAKTDYLKEFSCTYCQHYLTEQDISQGNYRLYVSDYANDLQKEEFFSERLGRHLTTYRSKFLIEGSGTLGVSGGGGVISPPSFSLLSHIFVCA